jgi:long-chain acyl-CoA synthetase
MGSNTKESLASDVEGTEGNGRHFWLRSYPEDVDWNAPLRGMPLQSLLERAAKNYGTRDCTYFMGSTLSFAEINALSDKVAQGLQQRGVRKGVNVGLLLPNTPSYVIMYFGILKAGGTVVNFNPLYTVEELSHQARDAELSMIVTHDLAVIFPKAEAMLANGSVNSVIVCPFAPLLPSVKSVLFRLLKSKDVSDWKSSPQKSRLISYDALIDNAGRPDPVDIDPENDVAVLQYTGGTTGIPKGAMLTHANLSINAQQIDYWASTRLNDGEERILGILPLFHVFAMTVVMNLALAKAATMILMPRFELQEALKLIRKTRPTLLPGVPTLYNAFMNSKSLQPDDMSSLKFCISGGAALPIEVKQGFERLSGAVLVEGYGLSETSPVATCNPPAQKPREGSIGLPLPGTIISVRSLDDPAMEMPLGENGEICIAGPQVMKGYWRQPKETADTMVGECLRTGDVGYMDVDGYTYIVDRLKDLIISSGFNVYPRVIEEAIYQHPAVEEVTVVGIPDNYRGEAPKAYVKLKQGASTTEADIIEFLQPKISKIEMPAKIEFRDELPKTLIGKLSKKELRQEQGKKA